MVSDDEWMLAYAASKQERRHRVEEAARDAFVDRQHALAEMFADALAKQRQRADSIVISGYGDTPPAVRDLPSSHTRAGDQDER